MGFILKEIADPDDYARSSAPMIDRDHPLLLGSGSSRRREMLLQLGIPLVVHPVAVDETLRAGETVEHYLRRVVAMKLAALAAAKDCARHGALLVADTVVVHADTILGKPRDDDDARAMLRLLGGKAHRVATRFAIAASSAPSEPLFTQTVETQVYFRALTENEIARYVATGEGRDKAGAYAIQGIGSFAVERIDGSYANVVGLPICEVIAGLRSTGLLGPFPLVGPRPEQQGF